MKTNAVAVVEGEQYVALVDELNALKTEQNFSAAVQGLQWAHLWGKTIRDYYPKDKHPVGVNPEDGRSINALLRRLAVDVGRTDRMLWLYIRLFDTYPNLEAALAEHGKNVSLNKLLGTGPHSEAQQKNFLQSLVKNLQRFYAENLTKREKEAVEIVLRAVESRREN